MGVRGATDVVLCHRDEEARRLLQGVLAEKGHDSEATRSADHAVAECATAPVPPVLVADSDRLRLLREHAAWHRLLDSTVLLVLVPEGAQSHALDALRSGADALLSEPVDSTVFLLQVEALLRREARRPDVMAFGGFTFDGTTETLHHERRPVHLTPTEFLILRRLASTPHHVVGRAELMRSVWGHTRVSANTLNVHMGALRRKLRRWDPEALQTVRGRGYRLATP